MGLQGLDEGEAGEVVTLGAKLIREQKLSVIEVSHILMFYVKNLN